MDVNKRYGSPFAVHHLENVSRKAQQKSEAILSYNTDTLLDATDGMVVGTTTKNGLFQLPPTVPILVS